MVSYKVILSPHALGQLEDHISYLLYVKQNKQAARSLWRDANKTKKRLSGIASSLKYCDHPSLKAAGYRIIHFKSHRYVMLYHIDEGTVFVEAIYHEKQNYESLFSKSIHS